MLLTGPTVLCPQTQSYQVPSAIFVASNLKSACLGQWCVPVNIAKFLRTAFFNRIPTVVASGFVSPNSILLRNVSNPCIHLIGKVSSIFKYF